MSIDLAVECVKLAIPLVSPSVEDRVEGIAQTSTKLYIHIKALSEYTPAEIADKIVRRRGRQPREE